MAEIVSLPDRVKARSELISNRGEADRCLRVAMDLQSGIETMRALLHICIFTEMESTHLEAQIQIFTDRMNEHKSDAIKLRAM